MEMRGTRSGGRGGGWGADMSEQSGGKWWKVAKKLKKGRKRN